MESASARILTGHTQACEVGLAVRELHAQISQPDAALVVVFCSTAYPRPVLAEALQHHFGDVPMIGCTTAGELGASGYQTGGITGFSLPAAEFTVATARLDGLDDVSLDAGQHCVDALLTQMPPVTDGQERFALLLVDGLSQREEPVAYALQRALGRTPLVGGSAGDGLHFGRSWVYHDGAFHTRSAVLALVSTRRRSRVFKTQHFTHDKERLVVTEADPKRRRVFELNGLPAAQEYARLIGVPVAELAPETFAAAPVVVVIDGTDYVRSIREAHADGSLTFFCAIELGLVLRVAQARDMVAHLDSSMDSIRAGIGEPDLVISFDCVLRRLEARRKHCEAALGERFRRYRMVGFSTYGEQYAGVHVNHTLTGVAIGRSGDE